MAKYSIDFKQKVIKYFKNNGKSNTLRVYNISATAAYNGQLNQREMNLLGN